MIKIKVVWRGNHDPERAYTIQLIEIIKEGPNCLYYERKGVLVGINKNHPAEHWFDSWKEAHDWIIRDAEWRIKRIRKEFHQAHEVLRIAKIMKPDYLKAVSADGLQIVEEE